MWKRSEQEEDNLEPAPSMPVSPAAGVVNEPATIGASIFIKGNVSGSEDLTVQGRVEGKIDLKTGNVTVGQTGRVKADIYGKTICIEGKVEGNLHGQEVVILRETGAVGGSIVAPRVNLADGARFQGTIDMGNGKQAEAVKASAPKKESPPPQGGPTGHKKAEDRKIGKSG